MSSSSKRCYYKRLNVNNIVSKAMYELDPACTSCTVNEGMEDEYNVFAKMLVSDMYKDRCFSSCEDSIKDWLIDNFTGYFGFSIEDSEATVLSKNIVAKLN